MMSQHMGHGVRPESGVGLEPPARAWCRCQSCGAGGNRLCPRSGEPGSPGTCSLPAAGEVRLGPPALALSPQSPTRGQWRRGGLALESGPWAPARMCSDGSICETWAQPLVAFHCGVKPGNLCPARVAVTAPAAPGSGDSAPRWGSCGSGLRFPSRRNPIYSELGHQGNLGWDPSGTGVFLGEGFP